LLPSRVFWLPRETGRKSGVGKGLVAKDVQVRDVMCELLIEKIAETFWWPARHVERKFPRDIESGIAWALPIFVVRLPRLSIRAAQDYLRQRQLPVRLAKQDRPLHGCVVAVRGKGVILVDGSDGANEVRFTLAHEVAHFLLDYQIPRQQAVVYLGERITQVLDGSRPATRAERIDGILARAPIELYMHFMYRDEGSIYTNRIVRAETRADLLAFELLAPETHVWRTSQKAFTERTYRERTTILRRLLSRRFGLPDDPAQKYSALLCRSRFGGPSVREWLGL
jgi:hypothetical protein